MINEHFDQWMKLNKGFATPLTEWHKATSELCQQLAQRQLEMIGENVSRCSDQLKRLTHVKKPEDFINLQKECINENLTATLECVQKTVQTSLESIDTFMKMYGSVRENVSPNKVAEKFNK